MRSSRRRLAITALVLLVLVSLVSWWYWPRGDARFIGKWAVIPNRGSTPLVTWEMSKDGLGTSSGWADGPFGLGEGSAFLWRASGNTFSFTDGAMFPRLLRVLKPFINPTEYRYTITSLRDGEIEMTFMPHQETASPEGMGTELRLKRIPE
jgi:hypothetical protein